MPDKSLFLLTKTYPYGSGEQYITNEIRFLSEKFLKVYIYPNDYYGKGTEQTMTLPVNVEVLNFNALLPSRSDNTVSNYLYLLRMAFLELINTDDRKYYFSNFRWNLINFWTQFQIAKRFSVWLKENNYTAENSVFYSYWFHKAAIMLSILKDQKQIKGFVARAHSVDLYHNHWGIIDAVTPVPPFKMFKIKHVSRIFTVSKHGEVFLKQSLPFIKDKVETSYLGVTKHQSEKEKIGISSFHIVTCGGIDSNKRMNRLAEALNFISADVKWTHFGEGALLENLKKMVADLPSNIKVDLKGNVPNSEIKDFYTCNHVDLFVNLSIVEGLPVSIMEAMSNGIPVIATAVNGTPEAVIENENGFLLDVNFSTPQLVEKLNFCITNTELLKKMGTKSFSIYESQFDAQKNYRKFANYLKSL